MVIAVATTALAIGVVVALMVYVSREDPYVRDGRSRWERYGDGPQAWFWAAVTVDVAAVVLAGLDRRRPGLAILGAVLATVGLVLAAWAYVLFSVN